MLYRADFYCGLLACRVDMASDGVAVSCVLEVLALGWAGGLGVGATGVEGAAGGGIDGVGDVALEDDSGAGVVGVGDVNSAEEGNGVGFDGTGGVGNNGGMINPLEKTISEDQSDGVREFYERAGWERQASGEYLDTGAYTDRRWHARDYYAAVAKRARTRLPAGGGMFAEIGCGALPATWYWDMPRDFERCICVDFALKALQESREKLGERAFYVQADVTRLPFRDGALDAAYCAQVLFHMAPQAQKAAFGELQRVVRPEGTAVVVHCWSFSLGDALGGKLNPRSWAPRIPGARWLWRRFFRRHLIEGVTLHESESARELFFSPVSRRWLRREVLPWLQGEVLCWQSVGLPFMQAFVPANRFGAALLRCIFWLECRFPRAFGWLGSLPLIRFGGRTR